MMLSPRVWLPCLILFGVIIGSYAIGFCLCAMSVKQITMAIFDLSLCAMGVVMAVAMFWALPTAFLGADGAVAGIALIN